MVKVKGNNSVNQRCTFGFNNAQFVILWNDFNERYLLDWITCAWQNHPDFLQIHRKLQISQSKWFSLVGIQSFNLTKISLDWLEAGPSKLDVSPSNIYLYMWSIFTVLPGRRQLFDPKLIVSDEDALKAWERDPLVSRGKLLWSQKNVAVLVWRCRLTELCPVNEISLCVKTWEVDTMLNDPVGWWF